MVRTAAVTSVMQHSKWTKSILALMGLGAILAGAATTIEAVGPNAMTISSEAPQVEYGETTTKSATPSTPKTSFAAPTVLAPPAPTEEPG